MRFTSCVFLMSLFTVAACGGSGTSGTTSPSGSSGTGTTAGTMSARIDGTLWTASTVSATKVLSSTGVPFGTLAVSGTGSLANQTVNLTFTIPAVAGAYTLGSAPGNIPGPQNASLTNSSTTAQWNATSTIGSGSITVTSLTLTNAVGAFAFVLPPVASTSATGTRVVTEGSFLVSF